MIFNLNTNNAASGGDDGSFKATIECSGNVISFPSDLTKVGDYAFYNHTGTFPTSLPNGVTSIGQYAFHNCTNLAFTSLPSGVTSIGTRAFYNCTNLALTSLPNTITNIDEYTFYDCTNLALTSLPSGITSIGRYAFHNCTNLALTSLPSGMTNIGNYVFYGCTNLALTSLPPNLSSISQYGFYNCVNLALTSLPSSITYIGYNSFQNCKTLSSISCDGIIKTLADAAFLGSSGNLMQLAHIEFPNMAVNSLSTAFGSSTAANACQKLEVADIGNTKDISTNAFANCYKLQTLVLRRTGSICTLANVSAFTNTPMRGRDSLSGTIYVPSALIETYKTATNWKTLYDNGTVTFVAIEGSE